MDENIVWSIRATTTDEDGNIVADENYDADIHIIFEGIRYYLRESQLEQFKVNN